MESNVEKIAAGLAELSLPSGISLADVHDGGPIGTIYDSKGFPTGKHIVTVLIPRTYDSIEFDPSDEPTDVVEMVRAGIEKIAQRLRH